MNHYYVIVSDFSEKQIFYKYEPNSLELPRHRTVINFILTFQKDARQRVVVPYGSFTLRKWSYTYQVSCVLRSVHKWSVSRFPLLTSSAMATHHETVINTLLPCLQAWSCQWMEMVQSRLGFKKSLDPKFKDKALGCLDAVINYHVICNHRGRGSNPSAIIYHTSMTLGKLLFKNSAFLNKEEITSTLS